RRVAHAALGSLGKPRRPGRRRIRDSTQFARVPPRRPRPRGPLHFEEVDLEEQRGVRRDHAAGPAGAVAELGRDHEPAGATDPHAGDALIPAADHVAGAEREAERLAPVLARVELRAGLAVLEQPAGVVHRDLLALAGFLATAGDDVLVLESRGEGLEWHVVLLSSRRAAGSGWTCPAGCRRLVGGRHRTGPPARSPGAPRGCAAPRRGTGRGPCASSLRRSRSRTCLRPWSCPGCPSARTGPRPCR